MLLLSNLTRNGTIGGIAARKLELGIQESEQLPQATMSRTSDERLDETPTAEVQGLRGDIEETPSIQGVVSRSDGSSSRIGEPAAHVHLSPAQVAAQLLRRERVQMSLLAQKLAKWALDRQTTPEMQSFMTTRRLPADVVRARTDVDQGRTQPSHRRGCAGLGSNYGNSHAFCSCRGGRNEGSYPTDG